MTQATPTRNQEIRAIHIEYEDFYRIGGGLCVIIVLILIGSWTFGENALGVADTMLGYITNVATEGLSVIATIIVIDQLNRRREREERKQALFRQAKSRSNDVAVEALDQIQDEGWWVKLLECYPSVDEGYEVDLSEVQWAGGVQLQGANLQQVYLRSANLQKADLWKANLQQVCLDSANLQGADLEGVNLQKAKLGGANLLKANLYDANLQEANLSGANLQQAHLQGANLQGANLRAANLQGVYFDSDTQFDDKTVLPDATWIFKKDGKVLFDKYWTRKTDMSRYTNPEHEDFWQPDEDD